MIHKSESGFLHLAEIQFSSVPDLPVSALLPDSVHLTVLCSLVKIILHIWSKSSVHYPESRGSLGGRLLQH